MLYRKWQAREQLRRGTLSRKGHFQTMEGRRMKPNQPKPLKAYARPMAETEPQNDDPRQDKTTLWLIGKLETLLRDVDSRALSIRITVSCEAESGKALKEPDESINARLYRLVETASDIKDTLNATANAMGICDDASTEPR